MSKIKKGAINVELWDEVALQLLMAVVQSEGRQIFINPGAQHLTINCYKFAAQILESRNEILSDVIDEKTTNS